MKQFLYNKSLTILLFVVSSLAMEAFLFIYLGFGVLPKYVLFDLALISFVSFIVLFMPCGRGQNILIGVLLFLQLVLSYMNICIYTALGDVFTFDMLSLVDETARVITGSMFPIWPLIFYSCLYIMDIVFMILIRKKVLVSKQSYRSISRVLVKNVALIGLVLSFLMYAMQGISLEGEEDDDLFVFSDKVLYSNFASSKQSLIKFGTWGYYVEEFFRRFYQVESGVTYTKNELLAFKQSSEYDPKSQKLYNVAKDSNVVVLMLESFEWYAIDPEITPTLYALANGYDFGERDETTGLYSNFDYYTFETSQSGKTLLTRNDYVYDSINGKYIKNVGQVALDESKFGTYGLTLTNYYSKSKTDYSEASVILGNYPYNQSFTTHGGILGYSSKNLYSNVNYNFTLPNLLKSSGAVDTTNYMHSYISTFYGRDTLMPQFGFDNILFLDQMSESIEKGDTLAHIARDSEVIDYYLSHNDTYNFMPKDQKFLSYYTTVTTHGEYSYNPLLASNYEFIDSVDYLGKMEDGTNNIGLAENYASMVRSYFASVLDTEYMVTLLIKYLMENNIFDSTMLVLFSDHQCYYDGMDKIYKKHYYTDNIQEGYTSPKVWERDREYGEQYSELSQDRYEVPAMIYSTKIDDSVVGTEEDAHMISKFTCAFDLTVSIYNLLGVDYNSSYYLGYPVFCEAVDYDAGRVVELGVPAYVSCTGGIFNEFIMTEDGKVIVYYKTNVTEEELYKFAYKVSEFVEKWYKITALYQYNMF